MSKSRVTVLSGLFVAIGLILPYLTGHAAALPGTVLLPMHLPILLCGLLCGPQAGLLVGIATPILSTLLTGMPAPYPMLPILLLQLPAMGFLAGLFARRLPLYPALLLAMAGGWAAYGLGFSGLFLLAGGAPRALSLTAALYSGIPGMALQLVLVPAIVKLLQRATPGEAPAAPQPDALAEAKALLSAGAATCVLLKNGSILHQTAGPGVSPLLRLYLETPDLLRGAVVVDKIIGKAAAMLLHLGGAAAIHTVAMSAPAKEYLEAQGIPFTYERCVDVIKNRTRDGICPIERSVLEVDDAEAGLAIIQETLQSLRASG